jgi:hypothetical protein
LLLQAGASCRSEDFVNPKRLSFLLPVAVAMAVALWPADAAAQRRVIRRGPGRVVVGVGYGYPLYRPFYGVPYFYDPFWWGFADYQFPRYPYPPYRYGYYDSSAELRIQVNPKQAEVYVDGYLTGTVDDFDGVFQRLRMPLGEHEVTIYAPGYHSLTQRMLFRPFDSYSIKDTLQPLPPGEAAEPRPAPSESMRRPPLPPRGGAPAGRPDDRAGDRDIDRADRFGSVAVRVQPADAEVLIDGERWEASAGERVLVQLSEGTHRVEVRKSGYRTYTSTVRVRAGETATLNVSLTEGQ